MTVEKLLAYLQAMPKDAEVFYGSWDGDCDDEGWVERSLYKVEHPRPKVIILG